MSALLYDLVIRGGTVITAGGRRRCDIGILGERVATLGNNLRGRRTIDAHDRWVTPGGVDPHVHLSCPDAVPGEPGWVDDFTSGSQAAFAGGITTLGNMSFILPDETAEERLDKEEADVAQNGLADVFLHPVIMSPRDALPRGLPPLIERGYTSIKVFMSLPTFESESVRFGALFAEAGRAGVLTLLHCEDYCTLHGCTARLMGEGQRSLTNFPSSRPPLAEEIAMRRAVELCDAASAPVYIVHLSSARALDVGRGARARGLPVYIETRPLYLFHTDERYAGADAGLYVAQPPLRKQGDVEALWLGLRDGSVDTIGSDHAPWFRRDKLDPAHDVGSCRPGVPELDTMLPLLMSAVVEGRLAPERFVALTAANPARLFGLWPRKGTIAEGSDADLVVWEVAAGTRFIRGGELKSRSDYSPYDGLPLRAWPQTTVRRGEVVMSDGVILAERGSGRVLRRGLSLPAGSAAA